jgi:hypothetical protein
MECGRDVLQLKFQTLVPALIQIMFYKLHRKDMKLKISKNKIHLSQMKQIILWKKENQKGKDNL